MSLRWWPRRTGSIANTAEEARQLTELYGADPAKVQTVNPGADLSVFRPGGPQGRAAARRGLGVAPDAVVLLFVGRVQPLKGPDVVLKAAARLLESDPGLRGTLQVVLVGGPSGRQERADPDRMRELAAQLGISDAVRFEPPCPQDELAQWYRAATLMLTPSHSESFGLVALEAQACGTPVVAASVGGLRTVVRDGVSGVLVDGHDPADWARAIRRLVRAPGLLRELSAGALRHASAFGWSATVDRLAKVYTDAMDEAVASRGGDPPYPRDMSDGRAMVSNMQPGSGRKPSWRRTTRPTALPSSQPWTALAWPTSARSRTPTWSASRASTSSPR